MRTATPLNSPVSPGIFRGSVFALLAVLAVTLCGTQMLAAQTPATAVPAKPTASAHKPVHPRKHPVAAHAQSPTPHSAATAPTLAPEVPKWPSNEKPSPASVTWDKQGLRIDAANSSLAQILEDVATATGAKVEGFDADQRIFGVYGPGQARDVLSQLLLGSGYNVMLVGDQGQGTPRVIVLSSRHAGTAVQAANAAPDSDEDADTDEEPAQQPQATPPTRPGFAPGGSPRAFQQMQRQQQQTQPQTQPPTNPQN